MKNGLSLVEILVALIVLATGVIITLGVMARGLMMIKKGENVSIASNLAMAQLEVYKDNFHMIPFFPGIAEPNNPSYFYPDRGECNDLNQTGRFVHHTVDISDLPAGTYYGSNGASVDFYHRANPKGTITNPPYYDLNQDGFANDIIEPLKPLEIKNVTFIPVVEIKQWNNGFDINEIKHIVVTVYWKERNAEGMNKGIKHISIEGFISRTKADPWGIVVN